MKKVLLALVVFATMGVFSSCTKENRCSCKVYRNGVHIDGNDSEVTVISDCSDWEKTLQSTWTDGISKVKCEKIK